VEKQISTKNKIGMGYTTPADHVTDVKQPEHFKKITEVFITAT
jgi:hypothetical protein